MFRSRVHLFEFNDSPFVPDLVREAIVEALGRTLREGRILKGIVDPYMTFLEGASVSEVLDLCAGSGTPAALMAEELVKAGRVPPTLVLTDLHPRTTAWAEVRAAFPDIITSVDVPVDATAIPADIARGRARTIINSFHHFPPPVARAILADAVRASSPIFIGESLIRDPRSFGAMLPAGTGAILGYPLHARKHRLACAALTWLIPAIPLAAVWDGIVSTMRMYTEEDLFAMVDEVGGASWTWRYGTFNVPYGGRGSFFYGLP